MPKDTIDYSNTIIYKISCKDKAITELHVGHTTNFIKRKYHHKLSCNNNKTNCKIYDTIRANGGWNNWEMVEIAKYKCKDSFEAKMREQEHYDNLTNILPSKTIHDALLETDMTRTNTPFVCECGSIFSSLFHLNKHRKTCDKMNDINAVDKPEMDVYDLVKYLIKENGDLKNLVSVQTDKMTSVTMELLKNGVTNNINSHNKAFNLNIFLNETCKNAMNITEFVESIKVQVTDLENLGEVGYIQGISNIITTNLKALDITERPVHCTDKKRETIYIKYDNKWEKEDENKTQLRKAIRNISSKNYKLLPAFREKYPGCQYADSKYSDKYNKMVIETMGGEGNDDLEKEDKIIRNISKYVILEK